MMAASIIAGWVWASALQAEERVVVKALSGRFEVVQSFQVDGSQGDGVFSEWVRFREPPFHRVSLMGWAWPGIYSISRDENWLFRTQKTGSGDSTAILYRIEDLGRVSEVIGFDEMIWRFSDAISRWKQEDLYHTGVESIDWSADSSALEITLKGSLASKSGEGIVCGIRYDLKTIEPQLLRLRMNREAERVVDGR